MKWYVVQTKAHQEMRAYENLLNQGYEVYLPLCKVQRLVKNKLIIGVEPLFSRYIFIRLDDITSNWFPIRSTRGVAKLLQFGKDSLPIFVADGIIRAIKDSEAQEELGVSRAIFAQNSIVEVKSGPFKGLTGFFKKITSSHSGEMRALLLIELLGKQQSLEVPIGSIRLK